MGQKPLDWLPNFTTDPPLPHSCPRLLRKTSADFRPRTPLTGKDPTPPVFFLHQLCKGNSIIGVRTRQSLRDSWIQIRPIFMRSQMSTRRHMARPMNLRQRRITPKNQQIILQDPGSATKAKGQFREALDDTESYLFREIIHTE